MTHCAPEGYECVMIILILDSLTNKFYPIYTSLLQSKNNESYLNVLQSFHDTFMKKLDVKLIVTPFDAALLTSSKNAFPDATITPCFVHFVKLLWKKATNLLLKKKNLIKKTKKMIQTLKVMALVPHYNV